MLPLGLLWIRTAGSKGNKRIYHTTQHIGGLYIVIDKRNAEIKKREKNG